MANDRIYLRHTKTGKAILLFKYYPLDGGWVFHDSLCLGEWMRRRLNESGAGADLRGDACFDCVAETGTAEYTPIDSEECICEMLKRSRLWSVRVLAWLKAQRAGARRRRLVAAAARHFEAQP